MPISERKMKRNGNKNHGTHNLSQSHQAKLIGTKSPPLHLVAAFSNWRLSTTLGKQLKIGR